MELKDTVKMMLSDDYNERFKAEYYQTKIRHDELVCFLGATEDKLPNSAFTKADYGEQVVRMERYLNMLEYRAKLDNIAL